MIVDFHTHVFPPWIKADPAPYLDRDPYFRLLYAHPKAKMATADDLIRSMDEQEIDHAVALSFGWSDQQLCVETNSYIAEVVQRYSGQLSGFCMVQPTAGEAALRELERCAQAGLRGIGELMPDGQGFAIDDTELLRPLVAEAQRLGLLLLLHASEPVGHSYPGKGTVWPGPIYRFLQAFPEATVVLAHLGGGLPFFALMPEVREAMRNCYVDTAALPFLYRPEAIEHVVSILGAERVLWGTDYPLLSVERFRTFLRPLRISPDARSALMGDNARMLLGLDRKP